MSEFQIVLILGYYSNARRGRGMTPGTGHLKALTRPTTRSSSIVRRTRDIWSTKEPPRQKGKVQIPDLSDSIFNNQNHTDHRVFPYETQSSSRELGSSRVGRSRVFIAITIGFIHPYHPAVRHTSILVRTPTILGTGLYDTSTWCNLTIY